jgi:N-acetylmuramoyl-L-alanine amidase
MSAYKWHHGENRWQSIDTMARTLIGEADGEDLAGKAAVAWTIRTRAERGGWYGDTIWTVCRQPYQFSCWNRNDPTYSRITSDSIREMDSYIRAAGVVCLVLAGDLANPAPGADHYYAPALAHPEWADKYREVAVVGRHRFFDSREPEVTHV